MKTLAMNSELDREIIRLKGHYQAKYGKVADDFEVILQNEINENFKELNANIVKASGQIKGQVRQIRFKDWKEAMGYGFGLASPFLIAFLVVSILGLVIIVKTKNGNPFKKLVENNKIVEIKGVKYVSVKKENYFKSKEKNQLFVKVDN